MVSISVSHRRKYSAVASMEFSTTDSFRFPLISRPVNQNDSLIEDVFVASAMDFRSQVFDGQEKFE